MPRRGRSAPAPAAAPRAAAPPPRPAPAPAHAPPSHAPVPASPPPAQPMMAQAQPQQPSLFKQVRSQIIFDYPILSFIDITINRVILYENSNVSSKLLIM